MIQQENSYMSTVSSAYDSTIYNEGILGNLENLLISKAAKEALEAQKVSRQSYTYNMQTDVRVKGDVSSNEIGSDPRIIEEWVIDLHKIRSRPLDDFFSKQKFEGIVVEVKENSFVARLRNLTEDLPDEEAEFAIDELSNDDMGLLNIGAVFYWNIGYLVQVAGQRYGCQMINFRRLPMWTSQELQEANDRATDLLFWLESV